MEVEAMVLSEICQTQKDECHMFSIICRIWILKYVSHEGREGMGVSKEGIRFGKARDPHIWKYDNETIISYASKNIK